MKSRIIEIAEKARNASIMLAKACPASKNRFLHVLADSIESGKDLLIRANYLDVENAKMGGMDKSRLDRLTISGKIIDDMRDACLQIANEPDPVGAIETQWQRPNGLLVGKMRIPLGVIAMIYEARPNVTIDSAILCLKSGNAVILKGGKEAIHTNEALAELLHKSLAMADLPVTSVQLVRENTHEAVLELCALDKYVDVIIPRGGEKLVRTVCDNATMPVLKHYMGVCHAYVDSGADLEKSCLIVENSKAQRPGVCNALECLLVNREIAAQFLPMLAAKLAPHNVEIRIESEYAHYFGDAAVPLQPSDFGYEFHAPILAVRIVDDLDQALEHISRYGSSHTEIICTENYGRAMRFLREADASMVAVNASTRFNDGGQLGLGAEIGISTSKIHSYGPMGIKELTTTKFVVFGNGQVRE